MFVFNRELPIGALTRLTVLLALAASTCGCPPASNDARTPVILISIDTCRPDRLGCYGHTGALTPNLDRLAAEGVVFEHAITPVPLTLP